MIGDHDILVPEKHHGQLRFPGELVAARAVRPQLKERGGPGVATAVPVSRAQSVFDAEGNLAAPKVRDALRNFLVGRVKFVESTRRGRS